MYSKTVDIWNILCIMYFITHCLNESLFGCPHICHTGSEASAYIFSSVLEFCISITSHYICGYIYIGYFKAGIQMNQKLSIRICIGKK